MSRQGMRIVIYGWMLALACACRAAWADEVVMKVLVVNPSESEAKEIEIDSPLPQEIMAEDVVDAAGLAVTFDPQTNAYRLSGSVRLDPKASSVKRMVLRDVWVIDPQRLAALRQELDEVVQQLSLGPHAQRGQIVTRAVERRLDAIEASAREPFLSPDQHMSRYRRHLADLQQIEDELASLRRYLLTVALPVGAAAQPDVGAAPQTVGLSVRTAWRLIIVVLLLLAAVSVSFFLAWRRQLRWHLAKEGMLDETWSDAQPVRSSLHAPDLPPRSR
jgi:hypothetical protein